MAIKGSLKEVSLADVIQMLALGRKTGVLSVTNGEEIMYIYFEDGEITGAGSITRAARIGDILVTMGKITEEQVHKALQRQKETPDLLLGEILYEMGYVDEDSLREALAEQVKQGLFYVFGWEEGLFNFEPGVNKVKKLASIRIKPEDLLLDAARIVDELGVIRLPGKDELLLRTEKEAEELDEDEAKVYSLIDGRKTTEEVIEASRIDEFKAMRAIGRLIEKGYIKSAPPPPVPREKALARISEHENLGIAFLHMEMFDEAEREFKRILELDPTNSRARFFLSIIRIYRNTPEDSVALLKEAINNGFEHPSLYANLGFYLERMGKLNEALDVLHRAIQRWPEVGILYLNRGIVLFKLKRLDEAEKDLRKYLEIELGSPVAYFYLGLIERIRGNRESALELMLEGLKSNPEFPEYYNNLGKIFEESEEFEEAEKMFKKALELKASFVLARKNLADFYYRNGYYTLASEEFKRLVSEGIEDWEVYFKLGNIELKKGDVKEAMRFYNKALQLNPDDEVLKRNVEILREDYGMGI